MTEIEVPDPVSGVPPSPYRNLFVPLVVVPALIVIVLILVFALFGAIAGRERSPSENLRTMMDGGKNERTQAAFSLARQVSEDVRAERDGDPDTEPPWGIDAGLLPEVHLAWNQCDGDDYESRFVLAILLAHLRDEAGMDRVLSVLREIPPEADPGGEIRFFLLNELGQLGDASAAPDVIAFLGDEDPGLRLIAASALQSMPGEPAVAALRETLSTPSLALRGQAAISLSFHGDATGSDVLGELLDPASYEQDRANDLARWTKAVDVRYARQRALWALSRLHRPEDRARIELLAAEDEDSEVQNTARHVLERWDEASEPGGSE